MGLLFHAVILNAFRAELNPNHCQAMRDSAQLTFKKKIFLSTFDSLSRGLCSTLARQTNGRNPFRWKLPVSKSAQSGSQQFSSNRLPLTTDLKQPIKEAASRTAHDPKVVAEHIYYYLPRPSFSKYNLLFYSCWWTLSFSFVEYFARQRRPHWDWRQ